MLLNFFKNLLSKDGNLKNGIMLRLVSLIAAILIWTSVSNIQHPIINLKFNAHLETVNEDSITYLGKSFTIPERDLVRVNYSVKAENAGKVRQSDFRVFVNLAELDGDAGNLQVYVELLNNVQVEDYGVTPQQVRVVTDDVVSKQVDVKYNIIGNLSSGLELGNILYSPTQMYITGPSATLDIIDSVKFDIDVNDQAVSFSDVANPYYVDRYDNVFDGPNIKRSAEVINYTVSIYSKKVVNINPVVVGELYPGRELVDTIVNPSSINLYGPKQLLDTITSINLPVVDISKLNADEEYTFNISELIPIGAITDYDGNTITLTVKIENNLNTVGTKEPRNYDNGEHPGPPPTEEVETIGMSGIPVIKETTETEGESLTND